MVPDRQVWEVSSGLTPACYHFAKNVRDKNGSPAVPFVVLVIKMIHKLGATLYWAG